MPVTAIVAHRGASARHPENTLRALRGALVPEEVGLLPADGYECDIRLTRDGVPVLFHDDTTERLTGEPGTIEARDLEAVRRLRVRGEPIPTLAQALDVTVPLLAALAPGRRALLNIEIKPTGRPGPLIEACRPLLAPLAAHARIELVVSSFDPRVLQAAMMSGAPWRLAFLFETRGALGFLAHLPDPDSLDLHPPHELVDQAFLDTWADARRGRRIRVWTVDEPARARALVALGIDAIVTNVPDRLRAAASEAP